MQIADITVPGLDLRALESEFEELAKNFAAAMEPGSVTDREVLADAAAELKRRARRAAAMVDKIVAGMPLEERAKAGRSATYVRGRMTEAATMLRLLRGKEETK